LRARRSGVRFVDWRECGADAFRARNTGIPGLADFVAGLVSHAGGEDGAWNGLAICVQILYI